MKVNKVKLKKIIKEEIIKEVFSSKLKKRRWDDKPDYDDHPEGEHWSGHAYTRRWDNPLRHSTSSAMEEVNDDLFAIFEVEVEMHPQFEQTFLKIFAALDDLRKQMKSV